jgi:hypothetical protein
VAVAVEEEEEEDGGGGRDAEREAHSLSLLTGTDRCVMGRTRTTYRRS